MQVGSRLRVSLLMVVLGCLFAAPVARAATIAVDDDGAQCPAAPFSKIQDAVDAAAPGDTIAICPGVYVEGPGGNATNALAIHKSLTLKGAGADLVSIEPRRSTPTGGTIAESPMNIRDETGDIVLVAGTAAAPIDVGISGVTVDGNGVFAKAGVVYLDAGGALVRDRVTHIATSISNTAFALAGGYRSNSYGYGIAQVTRAGEALPGAGPRALSIDHTRVDGYNKLGILIDGATGGALPLQRSGVVNAASLEADQVIGRVQCLPFNTPKSPPYVLGGPGATPVNELPGNCSTVGLTKTGPTFGQDGVRVSGGATAAINDTTIAQNLVNGERRPEYGTTENNGNLSQGAGVRLIDARGSSVTNSNVTDNAYGIFNVKADGQSANATTPVTATGDWWGLAVKATSNPGPAVSPTTNPPYQENPVNGTPGPEGSDAVHFMPYRNGSESDPDAGEWPVIYAPLPVDDTAPTISLATDRHDYDRGQTVTATASAGDDFGVTSISFYDGTELIATVTPPAASTSFTIPATAPCAARVLTAVASDFLGQTASASAEIAVVGPNECKGTGPPPPGPPVVKLNAPAKIGAKGATVTAAASADTAAGASVTAVDFYLGNGLLCHDLSAPYACKVLPTGAEVGTQSLRAVVTDSAAQTATDQAAVRIEKFAPKALTLKVKRKKTKGRRPMLVRKLTGRLKLPPRVTARQGCRSGTVTVTVRRGRRSVLPPTQIAITSKCAYKLRFTAPPRRKSKFIAKAKFGGNAVLKPVSTNRRFK